MTPRSQAFHFLPFGAIKPLGWLRAQMTHDLEHGFVGHLDELAPDLIQRDDIYGTDRLTNAAKTKELGVLAKESQWEVQFLWWNSETQSNWLDGMTRTALLLDQRDFIEKARTRIERLLSTPDTDGYLGIYAADLRFNFTGENGELWAQASLFRVLLGWHEAMDDEHALTAVRRAVDVTMRASPIGQSHPFDVKDDFAGVGHGLVFTDILDRLYQLTEDEQYLTYARWLYDEYSRQPLSQDDIQLAHLLDADYRFKAHGVHTYEHLRSLLTAAFAANDPQMDSALAAALAKLETCLTPSGAPIGDEFQPNSRLAFENLSGVQVSACQEWMNSRLRGISSRLEKTGRLATRSPCVLKRMSKSSRGGMKPLSVMVHCFSVYPWMEIYLVGGNMLQVSRMRTTRCRTHWPCNCASHPNLISRSNIIHSIHPSLLILSHYMELCSTSIGIRALCNCCLLAGASCGG